MVVNEDLQAVDTTWRELLKSHEPDARDLIAQHLKNFSRIGEREPARLPSAFAGTDSALARGILACGSDTVRPLIGLLHSSLARALPALTEYQLQHTQSARWILSFALIAECTGTPRPAAFDSAPLKPLVANRKELSDAEQRCAAFLALALGDTATARGLIGATPATYPQPVLRFEFNIYELIRYLADAIDQRRPADWIEPAWLEYLSGFPLHLAAEAAKWPDLFSFARILANVRGDRVEQIADDLHARVHLLAQQGQ